MQIKDFLNSVCEQIKYKPIRESISEELKNHIEEIKENYMQEGLQEELAEGEAIKQMGDSVEIGKKLNKIHRPKLDWKLVLIIGVLICFGFLIAWIKTTNTVTTGEQLNYMLKFMVAFVIGIIASIFIYFFDYTKLKKYSKYFYLLATIIIIVTLLFGAHINGIPYLSLGLGVTISASTIAIPLYILAFIGFLMNTNQESKIQKILDDNNIKININLVKIIGLSILSLLLFFIIPSKVSILILGSIYLILGTVKIWKTEENRKKKIFILWSIVILLTLLSIFFYIGNAPYTIERIETWFHPENDPQGGGWLGINRNLIIQSAQVFGEAEDMSNALELFDEGTEYAFISILAHYGWIVTGLLIATIILTSIKLIINSIKIKDTYGKMMIIGISCLFILQSVFNVLMNLNLWIESGFELPFVSYGGTGFVMNMLCLALVLSIYRRKDICTYYDTEKIADSMQ